jgi:pyruvate dehydrogenase E1 component alpha subunit
MSSGSALVPLPYSDAEAGKLLGPKYAETLIAAVGWMALGRALDARMQALQRQGRVGFYGAATGHEGVNVAAGLASEADDWVVPGLREQLVALVRGHDLTTYVHHLFADDQDPARGRNMPCHPTAREVHYVSMSSVIGTQIGHGVGLAYGLKARHEPGVALAFFGDGATSSNDFHAGLNFAGVWRLPVVFACANNQWAISVPVSRQTAAPSLAAKASAYGMPGLQVDGTDFLAVHAALSAALAAARRGDGPTLLELVVFRMTPHSSSDDPKRYQPDDWTARATAHDPVARLEAWVEAHGVLDRAALDALHAEADRRVRAAIEVAERTPPPAPASLTEDVYSSPRLAASPRGG